MMDQQASISLRQKQKYGYVRVSTDDQNPALRTWRNLRAT